VPPPLAAPVVERPRVEPEPVPRPEPVASVFGADVEEEKKFPVVPVAIAAVVLIAAIGGGAFLMTGGKPESGTEVAEASPTVAVTPVASTDTEAATDLPDEGDLVDPESAATDTAIDQALIDQEVQRRIETERLRLEAQRQQELRRTEEAAAGAARPAAAQEQPARPAAEPQVAEPTPAAATPPPATQPPPAAMPQPTLPMQQPTAQSVKEGDFVAVGTPGLVAPILANFSKPVYPPLARRQRVEGVVVVQALISEKGEVLEAKVLRGVKEDVGINEAAINAIKRSAFTPATKDGVKVRSYYTGTIPFRL